MWHAKRLRRSLCGCPCKGIEPGSICVRMFAPGFENHWRCVSPPAHGKPALRLPLQALLKNLLLRPFYLSNATSETLSGCQLYLKLIGDGQRVACDRAGERR